MARKRGRRTLVQSPPLRLSHPCPILWPLAPLYHPKPQGENAIEFVVNHSEMEMVFVAAGKLPKLAQGLEKLQARREGGGPRQR